MRIFQKKNTSRQIFLQFAFLFGIISVLFCVPSKIHAQDELDPKRGFHPAGSYALSNIETISTTSGNLMLRIPLVSLPAGRAGLSHSVGLHYNSKLYDQYTGVGTDPFLVENNLVDQNLLAFSNEGGWMYSLFYSLQIIDRWTQYPSSTMPQCPNPGEPFDPTVNYRYKLKMRFPDGSLHEFRPLGGFNHQQEDWFRFSAAGHWEDCAGPSWTATTLRYYSVDSTYMRLDVQNDGSGHVVSWTLYLPDGGRVTGGNQPNRIYDRNNNYIEFQYVADYNQTGHPAELIVDQMGRSLVIEHNYTANEDYVREQSFDGQTLTWTVKWNSMWVLKKYAAGGGSPYPNYDGPPFTEEVFSFMHVVERITLPAQMGGLSYTFTYNSNATWPNLSDGWGELSSITLPSGATASYQYFWDGVGNTRGEYLGSLDVLNNAPTRKDLTYLLEYDGGANEKTETWLYNFNTQGGSCVITKPDGGVVREDFTAPGHFWAAGLVHKTTEADGSVAERLWKQNIPHGMTPPLPSSGFHVGVNTYLKTEFRTVADSTGNPVKTAIKDFTYDKNGNVTQIAEYDWVPYSTIPHDIEGKPSGIPGGLTPKRVIVNTYYNPTPDASNTTTDDPDVYHKPTSPSVKRAIESSETRSESSSSSVLSRAESFYDTPSTTGNLTMERRWDSTKGGITRPLSAGNSISVTHQYDPFGNRTWTTDANGVQTQFIYDPINSHGNLYVTQTKVAAGTPVQQWTTQAYDFHTSLVTQSTDVDNNVTARTTYDDFGRPILVEEADGIAGVEKHTATEYSDTERRVIVRSDLNTTGDGKLITIQHYDQLGRICLTRRLESGDPTEATDKTKGVKIQTRYFAGDAGNPNGYELVSAPYRAATSGATGGEPGMAWKRTKLDRGGRVIEVETFIGATPPAPWGGNSVSSGKFTTEYDAEFTTVTDQAGKNRRSRVDALGRLVRVDEPDAVGNLGGTTTPVQPTDYAYNALDNLIQTSQTGVPNGGSTPVTQIRTFTFSSLGRLRSANNPESGPITYEYDANGNLKKKTDARGVFIDYFYDELNRNRTIDYSDTAAVNPDITRVYDNPAAGDYGKGKFWKDYAGGDENNGQNVEHKEVDSYDALGRPLSVKRKFKNSGVWSAAFTTSQTYDLAGHVKTKTHPSGRSVTYTYDVVGDLTGFTGNIGDGASRTYSTGIQYNPQGQLIREQFGTSTPLYHRRHYNSRGQLFDVRLGTDSNAVNDGPNPAQWTGASWNRGALRMFFSSNLVEYAWPAAASQSNNGNLYRQDHFVPTALDGDGNVTGWVMSADYYCYDSLNRVAQTAEETYTSGGGYTPNVFNQQFSYDRFGNRLVSSAFGTGAPNPGYKINGANNRLIAPTDADGSQALDKMRYDVSGNLIKDTHTQTGTSGNRIYDAENRMLSADGANGLANSYAYDADGHRTRRSINNGGEVWWQVFGISGELVAEYQLVSGTPTLKKEYGYRNGQLLVIAETTGTCQWLVTDALGTPRMIADQTGGLSAMKRRDYLPFGEELSVGVGIRSADLGYGADSTRQKFTGKERDDETGLYYFLARYHSNIQGRFTSVDPENAGAIEDDPQSWNGYAYARNNPLLYSDPDGRNYRICSPDGKECYNHSDDNFNAGRRAGTKDGFTFTGDEKYFEKGDIRDKDGNVIATYQQTSLDDPAHELAFHMQVQFRSSDLYIRSAGNAISGAMIGALIGGGTIKVNRINTTSPSRSAALTEAKLANGIPLSRGPERTIKPNTDEGRAARLRPGDNVRLYEYTNSSGQKIWIREDKAASYRAPGGRGDQGPHFNSGPAGDQNNLKNHHYWRQ